MGYSMQETYTSRSDELNIDHLTQDAELISIVSSESGNPCSEAFCVGMHVFTQIEPKLAEFCFFFFSNNNNNLQRCPFCFNFHRHDWSKPIS